MVKASFYFLADSPVDVKPVSRIIATISGTSSYGSSVTEKDLKLTIDDKLSVQEIGNQAPSF